MDDDDRDITTYSKPVSMTLEQALASGVDPKTVVMFSVTEPVPFRSGYCDRDGVRTWSDPASQHELGWAGPLVFAFAEDDGAPPLGFGMETEDFYECNHHDDVETDEYEMLINRGSGPTCEHYDEWGEPRWTRVAIYECGSASVSPGVYRLPSDRLSNVSSLGEDSRLPTANPDRWLPWMDPYFDAIRHLHALRVHQGLLKTEYRPSAALLVATEDQSGADRG